MEADPLVQAPGNLQSYNRYAYVWNNPLRATDPSGYANLFARGLKFAHRLNRYIPGAERINKRVFKFLARHESLAQLVQTGLSIFTGIVCGPCAIGITTGFSAELTYAQTGSYEAAGRAAFNTALTASMFYGVGQALQAEFGVSSGKGFLKTGLTARGYAVKIFAHGMVGGISAQMQGGKFGHGFVSAGFSAAAIPVTGNMSVVPGTVVSALIGGAVSELSGGKFMRNKGTLIS